jgi:hypothetical protein
MYAESGLFADVVRGHRVDLARCDSPEVLNADAALTLVASNQDGVFATHALPAPSVTGELRINPLYAVAEDGDLLRLTLTFPDADYADEYGACREYLPQTVVIGRADLAAVQHGTRVDTLDDLIARRVIVDLPPRYC